LPRGQPTTPKSPQSRRINSVGGCNRLGILRLSQLQSLRVSFAADLLQEQQSAESLFNVGLCYGRHTSSF
jgi:hypothetical protein